MKGQTNLEEILSSTIAAIILFYIMYILYVTPSAIQPYFQDTTDTILFGIILAVVIASVIYVLMHRDDSL